MVAHFIPMSERTLGTTNTKDSQGRVSTCRAWLNSCSLLVEEEDEAAFAKWLMMPALPFTCRYKKNAKIDLDDNENLYLQKSYWPNLYDRYNIL